MAITSPLLDNISVEGATGVLINIVGGPDLKLKEMEEAASLVQQQAHEDANIILGASIDESMGEMVKVTVIATGFDRDSAQEHAAQAAQHKQHMVSAPSIPMQSYAPPPPPRSAPMPAPVHVSQGRGREETIHAYTARRPPAGFGQPAHQAGLPMREFSRERIAMPAGLVDSEWDTPTFQRKGQ